jgi:uncharacterized membrane protein
MAIIKIVATILALLTLITTFKIGQNYANIKLPPEIDNSRFKFELAEVKENQQIIWVGVLIDQKADDKYLVTSTGKINVINKLNKE